MLVEFFFFHGGFQIIGILRDDGRALAAWLIERNYIVKDVNTALSYAYRKSVPQYKKNDSYDAQCVARIVVNELNKLPDAMPEDMYWTLSQLVNRRAKMFDPTYTIYYAQKQICDFANSMHYMGEAIETYTIPGLITMKWDEITESPDALGRAVGRVAPDIILAVVAKNIELERETAAGRKVYEGGRATSRPTWRQSELDAVTDFPDYDAQKSFINGEEVPYGTKGSVRPDYYKDGFSVDIKNYNVESASGRSNLARNIEKQYYQRIGNLPDETKQSVMIDVRGQNVSDAALNVLYDDVMQRTNNGVGILFKMD